MRTRALVIGALVAVVPLAALTACSSGSGSSSKQTTTTTTTPKNFQVQTPAGQVSVSLSGQLPPNWPSGFPLPPDTKPAGSGSLVNGSSGGMVAVFSTSESPQDAFDFYKSSSSLTVTSSRATGIAGAYLGTVSLGGSHDGGYVVVASIDGDTYIVVTLPASSSGSTGSSSSSSTSTTTSTS